MAAWDKQTSHSQTCCRCGSNDIVDVKEDEEDVDVSTAESSLTRRIGSNAVTGIGSNSVTAIGSSAVSLTDGNFGRRKKSQSKRVTKGQRKSTYSPAQSAESQHKAVDVDVKQESVRKKTRR